MKRLVWVLILVLCFGGLALAQSENMFEGFPTVRVFVDGKEMISDVPAINFYGRAMVPVRFVTEALHYSVDWDDEEKAVLIERMKPADYAAIVREYCDGMDHVVTLMRRLPSNTPREEREAFLAKGASVLETMQAWAFWWQPPFDAWTWDDMESGNYPTSIPPGITRTQVYFVQALTHAITLSKDPSDKEARKRYEEMRDAVLAEVASWENN